MVWVLLLVRFVHFRLRFCHFWFRVYHFRFTSRNFFFLQVSFSWFCNRTLMFVYNHRNRERKHPVVYGDTAVVPSRPIDEIERPLDKTANYMPQHYRRRLFWQFFVCSLCDFFIQVTFLHNLLRRISNSCGFHLDGFIRKKNTLKFCRFIN